MSEMIEEGTEVQDAEYAFKRWWEGLLKNGSMKEICQTIAEIEEEIKQIREKIREIEKDEERRLKYGALIPAYKEEITKLNEQLKQLKERRKELQRQKNALGDLHAKVQSLRSKGKELWGIVEKDLMTLEGHVKAYLELQTEYSRLKAQYNFLNENGDEDFPPPMELSRDIKMYVRERISKL